jgi:hypothetical protein
MTDVRLHHTLAPAGALSLDSTLSRWQLVTLRSLPRQQRRQPFVNSVERSSRNKAAVRRRNMPDSRNCRADSRSRTPDRRSRRPDSRSHTRNRRAKAREAAIAGR